MALAEEWREIPGYEGLYEVSNYGNVRSLPRTVEWSRFGKELVSHRSGRQMSHSQDQDGYRIIGLTNKDGVRKTEKVHRLVCAAFIGPCPDGYQVGHIDENKANNFIGNLEYVTCKENINHGMRTEKAMRKRRKPVAQFESGEIVDVYKSISEAARKTGCSDIEISRNCRGLNSGVKGFQWRYLEVV